MSLYVRGENKTVGAYDDPRIKEECRWLVDTMKLGKKIIKALQNQNYQHEIRATNEKNLLSIGEVTPDEVIRLIGKSSGINHTMSMHHQIKSLQVYLIKIDGWYIKFYFIDPNAIFISVHK